MLSGRIIIRMDDGSEELFEAGDIMMLPPGHDAWTVGDEPCDFIEFSQGNDYYDALQRTVASLPRARSRSPTARW